MFFKISVLPFSMIYKNHWFWASFLPQIARTDTRSSFHHWLKSRHCHHPQPSPGRTRLMWNCKLWWIRKTPEVASPSSHRQMGLNVSQHHVILSRQIPISPSNSEWFRTLYPDLCARVAPGVDIRHPPSNFSILETSVSLNLKHLICLFDKQGRSYWSYFFGLTLSVTI